jgi:hypothetical protein
MNHLKKIITFLFFIGLTCCTQKIEEPVVKIQNTGAEDRAYTISMMQKVADPVFVPLSQNRLKEVIPRKAWETRENAIHTSRLQAFGRTLSGMAPWLSLGVDDTEEGKLRAKYIDLALKGIINGTNPEGVDYLLKEKEVRESIVHLAYLAFPLLVAQDQLWEPLTEIQKRHVIECLKVHRQFVPPNNNWLLFSAIIESAIWKFSGEHEMEYITHAIESHLGWYLGDGTYSDGEQFHWDYYNSYVIQPLLLEVLYTAKDMNHPLKDHLPKVEARAGRYAEVIEHLISPEGTFPVIGRSSVYRIAPLNIVGYVSYRSGLPKKLEPGSTRAALTSVIGRMMGATGTFDENGWLTAGLVGEQIDARDNYNYTGALYFCSLGFTHLGVPADDPFWTQPAGKWFQQKVWSGDAVSNQKPYYEK